MSTRSYRGNRGKNVYEIANFSKGVNATNAAMPPGYLKELVNMNISPDGLSLRPREPYLNYALYLKGNDNKNGFVTLSNRVGMFVSKQFPNWEFIIDFFGKRNGYEEVIEDYRIIDGDTFVDNRTGIRYRLLIVDAYELGTEEGQQAKEFVELITNGNPITVRYDSQAPSWVDKYNRHLVWAYTEGGQNIQKALIVNEYAKYLDLRVTEHEDDILSTYFDGEEDYEGNTLFIEDYPGGIPVVYRRDIKQPPELIGGTELIKGRPAYILYEFNNIFMGDMLNDLEIGYSYVPDIKINKVNSEFGRYITEYNPLEQNKMPNHDGIVALVNMIGEKYYNAYSVDVEINVESELTLGEVTNLTLEGEVYYNAEVDYRPSQNIEAIIEVSSDLELGTSSYVELISGVIDFEMDYQYYPSKRVDSTLDIFGDLELGTSSYVELLGNVNFDNTLSVPSLKYINGNLIIDSNLELALSDNFELLSNVEFIGSIVEAPLEQLDSPTLDVSATCSTTGYESNPTYTFRIGVTNNASVPVVMNVSINGIYQQRNMNVGERYVFTRASGSQWSSAYVEAYASSAGYSNSNPVSGNRGVSCPLPNPDPQPTLTWQYNGPSSSQVCLPAGYNPTGTSCTVSGQTILVSGEDIGRPSGCYELICKI